MINCVGKCNGEHSVLMRTVPNCRPITSEERTSARSIWLIVVKPTMTVWQVQILYKLGEDTMPLAAATSACPVIVLSLMGLMILRLT